MTSQNAEAQGRQAGGGPESGQPGSGSGVGRKDVTGIAPEGTHVDPDITEGHPGYQESGGSEIHPPARPIAGQPTRETPPA